MSLSGVTCNMSCLVFPLVQLVEIIILNTSMTPLPGPQAAPTGSAVSSLFGAAVAAPAAAVAQARNAARGRH